MTNAYTKDTQVYMKANFTLQFTTKIERALYKQLAKRQGKSLGLLVRELLGREYDASVSRQGSVPR